MGRPQIHIQGKTLEFHFWRGRSMCPLVCVRAGAVTGITAEREPFIISNPTTISNSVSIPSTPTQNLVLPLLTSPNRFGFVSGGSRQYSILGETLANFFWGGPIALTTLSKQSSASQLNSCSLMHYHFLTFGPSLLALFNKRSPAHRTLSLPNFSPFTAISNPRSRTRTC